MSTRATEVSIHAVSPPLGVQFVSTAGTAATAAYLSVSGDRGDGPRARGSGRRRRLRAAGAAAAGAAAAGAAGAAAAGASVVAGAAVCATAAAGARPMKSGCRQRRARRESLRVRFIVGDSNLEWEAARRRSERVLILLARADPHRRVEAVDEDLAVADLAGARRSNDRLDHLVGDV